MPIAVTCPECQANYRVADEAAGKAIKCKKCGARVPVPAAAAEGGGEDDFAAIAAGKPSSKPGRSDDDDGDTGDAGPPKKKGGSNKMIYIIVGVLVGFCCLCTGIGGGVGYWLYSTGKQIADDVQKKGIIIGAGVAASGPTVLDSNATLTAKDPMFNGKPAKSYKVKLEANKDYVIDMKATGKGFGHDPYLILLDPKNQQVAQDDDSGGGLDAQIVYRPAVAGEYTIQATCLAGVLPEGLPFHLTVKLK